MSKTVGLIPKENLIRQIGASYAVAARAVATILRDLDPMTYTETAGSIALSKIKNIVDRLDAQAAAWASKSIKAAYNESRMASETRLDAIGAVKPKEKKDAKKLDRHAKAINKFVRLTARDYYDANRTILKNSGKYLSVMAHAKRKLEDYREDVRTEAFSSEEAKGMINSTVKKALKTTTKYNEGLAHLTSQDVSHQILDKLLKKISGQDFITITGKDGIPRNYDLRSYAELVARTRMRNSQTEAVKEACAEYDNDLVEIPRHDNPCELCSEYQGNVYSISGKHPDYPELPDGGPPWHPNCEDVMNPISERALRWRKA